MTRWLSKRLSLHWPLEERWTYRPAFIRSAAWSLCPPTASCGALACEPQRSSRQGRCVVEHIRIEGGGAANGGIDIDNCGLGYVQNVEVTGFTNAKAVAIRLHESYRIKLSYIYIYTNYIGIKFSGNVTTFEFNKGNIAVSSYRALEASGGSSDSIELYFTTVYLESNTGNNPVYFNATGDVVFLNCGFEANCGSGADPKVLRVENPSTLTLRSCRFSGFNSDTFRYSGVAYFVYLGNDAPRFVMDDGTLIQNHSMAGFKVRVFRSANTGIVSFTNNRLLGTAIANDLEAQRIMLGGVDVAYPPRSYKFENNRALNAFVQRTSPLAITRRVTTSAGLSSPLYSKQFPAGAFYSGSALKIKAWGRRSGTAGGKSVQLGITADTLSTWPIAAAVTTADDWVSEVVILFRAPSAQSLSVMAHDGTAAYTASTQLTKNTDTYDTTIAILSACSSAADSITLDGLVMEWL
jgi:hypothetical protein